jgi:hypothetical protein
MQELKLADDLFVGLFDGTKRSCVELQSNVTTGSLALEAASGGYGVIVNVTRVEKKMVSELTADDAKTFGVDSVEELVNGLKNKHPEIAQNSLVDVIVFDFRDVLDIPEEILFGESEGSEI